MFFSPYLIKKSFILYLEGNEVNRFLANIDILAEIIPVQFFGFIPFFKDMANMMESVFGYTLDPNYKDVNM